MLLPLPLVVLVQWVLLFLLLDMLLNQLLHMPLPTLLMLLVLLDILLDDILLYGLVLLLDRQNRQKPRLFYGLKL